MKKKIISLLTTLVMVVGLAGVMPTVSAGAAGGVQSKVQAYADKYNGKYKDYYYTPNGSHQCYGYAQLLTENVFGSAFYRNNKNNAFSKVGSASSLSGVINLVKSGDVLNRGTSHTAVVVSKTSSTLVVTHSIGWSHNNGHVETTTIVSTKGYNDYLGGTQDVWRANNYNSIDGGHTCNSNNSYISKNPTCTSTGTRTYTCSQCGKVTRTETISALGHNYGSWTTTKYPTCTTEGSKYQTCSRCGNKNTQSLSKTSHSYIDSEVKPTSTNDKGYTIHTCRNCGYFYKDNYIELKSDGYYYASKLPSWASSNDYVVEYKSHSEKIATSSPGSGWINSGVYKTEYQNVGSPYEKYHYALPTSNERVLVSTMYYHFCGPNAGTKVNYDLSGNYVHWDSVDGSKVSVASQGTDSSGGMPYYILNWNDGSGRVYCKSGVTCDGAYGSHGNRAYAWYKIYTYQDRTKVTYYKFVKDTGWTTSKDNSANSVEIRFKRKQCTHSYKSSIIAPTCTSQGYTLYTCTVCGNSYKDNYKNAIGHSYTKKVVSPTCTSQGYTLYTCTKCGSSYKSNYTNKTSHSYGSWTMVKSPTCTASGSKKRVCIDCGASQTATVSALGHNYKTTTTKPTATSIGYTVHKCSRCSTKYTDAYKFSTISGFKTSSVSSSAVKLTWNKVSGAQGYIVYKYDNSKKTYVRVKKTTTNTASYTVTGLSSGTSYKFAVKPYKTVSGKEVTSSSFPTVTAITKLPTVVNGTPTVGKNSVKLTWNKTTGAAGYIVYKYDNSKKTWVRVAKTSSLNYTVKNLKSNTSYKFTVKAYKTVSGKEITSASFTPVSVKTKK